MSVKKKGIAISTTSKIENGGFAFIVDYLIKLSELESKMNTVEILNGRQVIKKHLDSDGEIYEIEFMYENVYRIYKFNNPDVYSKL